MLVCLLAAPAGLLGCSGGGGDPSDADVADGDADDAATDGDTGGEDGDTGGRDGDSDGAPVDGACGSANGVATTAAPTSGLCSAGTPSDVAGGGPWTWTCAGASGGTTATCSAPVRSTEGDIGTNLAAAGRITDWSHAGVPGGVPHRTTVCATLTSAATASAINDAISSCDGGVVELGAGTYSSLGGAILLNRSDVTLRGAGADQTIIPAANAIRIAAGGALSLGTAITGGATMGSTSITVESTDGLSVGTIIEIDRADDRDLVPYFNSWSPSDGRSITQTDVITAIAGDTVTLRTPLFFDFASGDPEIKLAYAGSLSRSGVEDLRVDLGGEGGYGIQIESCDSCWVRGVDVGNGGNYMIQVLGSVNFEIRDSYIHDGGTGPNHAGIAFFANYTWGGISSARVENNIINGAFPNVEINNSVTGLFIGYNYSPGSNGGGGELVTWNLDDNHAPFPIMNLYEGNVADMFGSDGYFGGSGYGTALRNHLTGYNPNFGARGTPVVLKRLAYYYNVVGNVLGSSDQAPVGYATGCIDSAAIYELGFPNIGNCDTVPWDGYETPGGYPDPMVASTLARWGNFDYVNGDVLYLDSEIPDDVEVPTNRIIPASFAYAATPGWWPSTTPWPPIGPDVTGGTGDGSGHVHRLPAQECWESSDLADGGAFDAASCY